jgi:hypothetical protein
VGQFGDDADFARPLDPAKPLKDKRDHPLAQFVRAGGLCGGRYDEGDRALLKFLVCEPDHSAFRDAFGFLDRWFTPPEMKIGEPVG